MRWLPLTLCTLLLACGASEPEGGPGPAADGPARFDVPVMSATFHAEVRALEVLDPERPGEPPAVRTEIRLLRDDGTDVGVARSGGEWGPTWTGIVPAEGVVVEFGNLMSAPDIPAPLNVVRLTVSSAPDGAGHAHFELESQALCIR